MERRNKLPGGMGPLLKMYTRPCSHALPLFTFLGKTLSYSFPPPHTGRQETYSFLRLQSTPSWSAEGFRPQQGPADTAAKIRSQITI